MDRMDRTDEIFDWALRRGLVGEHPDWGLIRSEYRKEHPVARKRTEERDELIRVVETGQSLWAEIPKARIVIGPLRGKEDIKEIYWKAQCMGAQVNWLRQPPAPGRNTWVHKKIHELEIGFWLKH